VSKMAKRIVAIHFHLCVCKINIPSSCLTCLIICLFSFFPESTIEGLSELRECASMY